MNDKVDNALLRARVLAKVAEGCTWQELAILCGQTRSAGDGRKREGDGCWLRRRLGIMEQDGVLKTTLSYDCAVRIARALSIDPVDVGI